MTDSESLAFCVLTVSSTRSFANDGSGDYLCQAIERIGHRVVARDLVKDDISAIRQAVVNWAYVKQPQAIVITGGTGFTGSDVTPEALAPLYVKEMTGFSSYFQRASIESVGFASLMSRATAGLVANSFVFAIPGSTGACKDFDKAILVPGFTRGISSCNFLSIIDRVDE